jgi:hypothetical protein
MFKEVMNDLWLARISSLSNEIVYHGPKFREPQHINWKHNFKIIMDAVKDYARRWIKREVDQDPQITSDYMSRWVVLKRRVGAVTSQRVLKVLFYVNLLQCFFVVENCTANAPRS